MNRISHVNANKEIKSVLERTYDGVRFSIRKDNSVTRVVWQNGPTVREIKTLLSRFEGAYMGGYNDPIKEYKQQYDESGNPVDYQLDWIVASRYVSADKCQEIAESLAIGWGFELPTIEPQVYDGGWLGYSIKFSDYDHLPRVGGMYVDQFINKEIQDTNLYTAPTQENTDQKHTTPKESESSATITTFKGHQVISLDLGSNKAFTFGVKKAKAILDNLDAIKDFVESNS